MEHGTLMQKKIDDAAIMWNKTKDPQYKDLWYKLIKEFANGPHNIERWNVSVVPLTKQMMEHMSFVVEEIKCFDLCDIIRLHLTTYYESPFNAYVMKDGSGDFFGCICN